jgi:hypothetical protein
MALDFWFKCDYHNKGHTNTELDQCCNMPDNTLWNSNWWWNWIGMLMWIGPICLLLESQLGLDRVTHCSQILQQSNWWGSRVKGANLLWMAHGAMWDGMLTGNVAKISATYKASATEAHYTPNNKDRIKNNSRFLNHNIMLYTSRYSVVFTDVFIQLSHLRHCVSAIH